MERHLLATTVIPHYLPPAFLSLPPSILVHHPFALPHSFACTLTSIQFKVQCRKPLALDRSTNFFQSHILINRSFLHLSLVQTYFFCILVKQSCIRFIFRKFFKKLSTVVPDSFSDRLSRISITGKDNVNFFRLRRR